MREPGSIANYNILIVVAVSIITANDHIMLKEKGGTIELGWKWCESAFKLLIINIGQLPLPCVLISKYLMEEKGASRNFVP